MTKRPSQHWCELIAEEARQVAAGIVDPECAWMTDSSSENFLSDTDAVLAEFQSNVNAIAEPTDDEVFNVVGSVVLALNEVNDRYETSTFDTDEREQLCVFIDEVLTEHGIDVPGLAARHGISRYEITDKWRHW